MQPSSIRNLYFSLLFLLFPLLSQAQADLNGGYDMSSSSPLWPVAGMVVVGLGFIILFQYKHRKNLK